MDRDPERHSFTVTEAESGVRVDRMLAVRLPELSRSRLKKLIESGALALGGQTINEPSYRVKPGQELSLEVPPVEDAEPEAQAMPLVVVYEDAEVIVVDKPAGMVVHPAPGNPDRTLVNALIAHCGDGLRGIGGVRRPGIVHRLDKDTSGLMVAAKTERAQASLSEQFESRAIGRLYLAVVWGVPSPAEGEISGNIGRNPRNRKKMAVVARGGKPATTRYKVMRALARGAASLVECRLTTGRTHQIRVHLTDAGHPLIGDPLYGRSTHRRRESLSAAARAAAAAFQRQALHAAHLAFDHPVTGERLTFTSDLPRDLRHLIDSLEQV
ncbi:MAG: RluA family pseudouridine synthase [Rhodovibrionaceae bacterium]|nr:RluA family pseudouridine synthase [Rhodovibrionaceae bacterium]